MDAVRSALAELDPDSVAQWPPSNSSRTQPPADRPAPEEQLAVALSGWIMGTDQTLQSLPDTLQLVQARQLLLDFLAADRASDLEQSSLLDQLSSLTPLTAERAAALIGLLPSPVPLSLIANDNPAGFQFALEPDAESFGAIGRAPRNTTSHARGPSSLPFLSPAVTPPSGFAGGRNRPP
jgi:hypothetical protein